MKLKRLVFRNFTSYGQKDQVIDIPEKAGLFLVQGPNGSGKTSIPDIMRFLWYGKVDGKNKSDLPNRLNKSAYVRGEGVVRGRNVVVERGISPNLMELKIDGQPYDKANSGVGPSEYLSDELLEIPSYVFNNAICLSIRDFKSFLKMSAKDKRSLMDRIFGFQIINEMKDILSKLQSHVKNELIELEARLNSSTHSYENSLNEMTKLSDKLKSDNSGKIRDFKARLKQFEDLLILHKQKLDAFLQESSEHRKLVLELTSAQSQTQSAINGIVEKLNLYKNKQCPTCQTDLSTDFHHSIKKSLEEQIEVFNGKIEQIRNNLNTARKKDADIESKKRSFIEKGSKIQHTIDSLKSDIRNLSNDKIDEQLNSIKNIVDGLQKDISEVKDKKTEKNEKNSWYKILEESLGDKGIKQLAMQTIIPAFNAEIYKMMGEVHLNYQVVFDDNFDARIMHLGEEISPATLSAGESVKVDFVILISFIRLLIMKFPSINVMFLDEIFANIDTDGIYVTCKILKRITEELNINIFVVSHNPLPTEVFDYKIDVGKINGFSQLKVEKLI